MDVNNVIDTVVKDAETVAPIAEQVVPTAAPAIEKVVHTAETLYPIVKEEVASVKAEGKKWFESKVVWINTLALAAAIAQIVARKEVIPAGDQSAILTALNLILRIITKENIVW